LTDQDPDLRIMWTEFKADFKKSPVVNSLFLLTLPFSIGGFVFNNIQNPNQLFVAAWFYDAFFLSWTNLLVIPTLLVATYWGFAKKDWSDAKGVASWFFWSPFVWIAGYLILRLASKIFLLVGDILTQLLTWLGN